MRATVIYGAGDIRVENVPDAALREPTDAIVRVVRSCVCGSDLWPYAKRPASDQGDRIGHEFLGVVEETGSAVSGFKPGDLVVAPFVWADKFLRNITVTRGVAPARAYIEELLPDILEGRIEPGRVFDRTVTLDEVPAGYRAMADREALKVMIES